MYYLDLFKLYKPTKKSDRVTLRKALDRNSDMAHLLKLQHNLCFFCGCEIDMDAHLDHLIPLYYGGRNNRSNLVAACRDCNLIKSTQQIEITNPYTIADFLRLRKAYRQWQDKVRLYPRLKRFQPKRVRLYHIYRADLFSVA